MDFSEQYCIKSKTWTVRSDEIKTKTKKNISTIIYLSLSTICESDDINNIMLEINDNMFASHLSPDNTCRYHHDIFFFFFRVQK